MPALTSLRFLAAALVFLYHFPPPEPSWPVAVAGAQGHVGVTVFFVLSGFLITLRYSDALGRPGGISLNEYFRKRVARIVPLYWAVLAASLVLATGELDFSWRRLPEWVLLQGYVSRSIGDLAIPTSWTLTLEESFYVSAPVLFLWLRRGRSHGAWLLFACTIALLCIGLTLRQVVDPDRFQFLGSAEELFRHTFFGRFLDFALGVWAGRLFLSGRVREYWSRPGGHVAAAALGIAGMGLIFTGQVGMTLAGGFDSPRWVVAWPFNLAVAAGSLLLILSLTCSNCLLSRVLGFAPFVYLGRVSYALYVIQLTPLGKGLLYRLIPPGTPHYELLMYVGMTLVSAVLYELVEEPGRRLVMSLWPAGSVGRSQVHARPAQHRRIAALVAVVSIAVSIQAAVWAEARASGSPAPPTLAETQEVAQTLPDRILEVPVEHLKARPVAPGTWHRIPIPEGWMIGTPSDRRAPPSLLVYADGEPVPFERRVAEVAALSASAFLRGPRATFVELRLPDGAPPTEVTLVRHDVLLAASLFVRRIVGSSWALAIIGMALFLAIAVAWISFLRWRPRVRHLAAVALLACTVYVIGEVHLEAWAPVVLAAQLLALPAVARMKAAAGASAPGRRLERPETR